MKKRILAFFLLFTILCLSGCSNTKDTSSFIETKPENVDTAIGEMLHGKKKVSLACSVTDSFSPYSAATKLNRDIATLLYDSLIRLDNTFSPVNLLAEEIEVKGKNVTVTIKEARFSDGTAITADDVVYCAKKAKKSSTKYGDNLSDASSISAASSNTVVFKLKKADPYFANLLDFPIYKANSDKESSSDNIEIPPIGSGMYMLNEDKTELIINPEYHGKEPRVKKISLVNTPDSDALVHNLEVGNVTCYYSDLQDCNLPQVRGGYEPVTLNNLVFLGANMKEGLMALGDMRQVVSTALDRESIAAGAYYQNAIAANSIFNPAWCEQTSAIPSNENAISENVYLALLGKIGYNKKDSGGYYVNSDGERLEITLIYYEGNTWRSSAAGLIKDNLRTAGIKVNLQKLSWKDYLEYVKKGYYDLYLAEVKIGNNMDITELVTKGGSAAHGVHYDSTSSVDNSSEGNTASSAENRTSSQSNKEEEKKEYAGETAAAVEKFYEGKGSLADVSSAFSTELPIIPVVYRRGILSYTTDISGMTPTPSDVYCGIGNSLKN